MIRATALPGLGRVLAVHALSKCKKGRQMPAFLGDARSD
jgi:hypothetical protein